MTYNYTYDADGNLQKISESNGFKVVYDSGAKHQCFMYLGGAYISYDIYKRATAVYSSVSRKNKKQGKKTTSKTKENIKIRDRSKDGNWKKLNGSPDQFLKKNNLRVRRNSLTKSKTGGFSTIVEDYKGNKIGRIDVGYGYGKGDAKQHDPVHIHFDKLFRGFRTGIHYFFDLI